MIDYILRISKNSHLVFFNHTKTFLIKESCLGFLDMARLTEYNQFWMIIIIYHPLIQWAMGSRNPATHSAH